MKRALLMVAFSALVAACGCSSPAGKFPELAPPDRSCAVGWDDAWIWDCRAGQHMVVHRVRGEYACSDPQKEVAPCGTKTPYEEKHERFFRACEPGARW